MTLNEQALKKELSLGSPKPVYLLYGSEPALLTAYRRRLLDLFGAEGEVERLDAKALSIDRLWEDAQLIPMLGGRRIFSVEDLDPEALADADAKTLCTLLAELPETTVLLLTAKPDSFDAKKGTKKAKNLLAAADKAGVVAELARRTTADLKSSLRGRCEKLHCELSADAAAFLIERCGDDLGTLMNECDKLCAYVEAPGVITRDIIARVCPPSPEGDVYALARLLLRGEAGPVLREIDQLVRLRHPIPMLISTLGSAFCDLYRAACARAAGRDQSAVAKDFSYRFEWKVKNAFRDSARLDPKRLLEVCRLLCQAEYALKSGAVDDRALLDAAVLSCLQALRGERTC